MSEHKLDKTSILEMAQGAIKERVDYEMSRILDNILDINASPTKKRQLTLTLTFVPDSDREQIRVDIIAKSKLEPTNAVNTSLYITSDAQGEMVVAEMVPQIPGQTDMDGDVQSEPKILSIAR